MMLFTLFNRVSVWWREGSWCHPGEWVFEIIHPCENKCTLIYAGFIEITILRNGCRGDNEVAS